MLYAIIATDQDDILEMRLKHRPEHLARLNQLLEKGRLILAGGHPAIDAEDPGPAGFTGSLIVAHFGSLEEAQDWAEEDAFWRHNVWSELQVKPLRKALP